MMNVDTAAKVAFKAGHTIAEAVVPNQRPEITLGNRAERRRALSKLGLLSQRKRAKYGLPERYR